MKRFIILDWAGNRIDAHLKFKTFEDAWDYILGDLTDRLGLTEEDYQEYQVDELRSVRESRYLDPKDHRAGKVYNR
jgi:hypothetical protein